MAKSRTKRASSRVSAGADPRAPAERTRKYNAQGKALPADWTGSYKYKGKYYNARGQRISERRFKKNLNEYSRRNPTKRKWVPRKLSKGVREAGHDFTPKGLGKADFAISTADPTKSYPFFADCVFRESKLVGAAFLYGTPYELEGAYYDPEEEVLVLRSTPVGVYTVTQFVANRERIEQGLEDEFGDYLVEIVGYWRSKNDVETTRREKRK
jgi:hypothetical protein